MKIDLTVTKKQKSFIDAKETEVLFGGAAGGGGEDAIDLTITVID